MWIKNKIKTFTNYVMGYKKQRYDYESGKRNNTKH